MTETQLNEAIEYLRGGDYGLVRPGPSDLTYERQMEQNGPCSHDDGSKLPAALELIIDKEQPLVTRGKALEVAVLCTANQPQHRKFIGEYKGGKVLSEIVKILKGATHTDQGDNTHELVEVAAQAGEAVWILSFSSAQNHAAFIQHGAIQILSNVMLNCDVAPICAHARMWAAAALQNLMASYCETDSGHCWWEWHHDNESDNREHLSLHGESPVLVDSETIRQQVLSMEDLVTELKEIVCRGPSDPRHGDIFPGEGNIKNGQHLQSENIVTWSATGAIKNLALSSKARKQLLSDDGETDDTPLSLCLCEMVTSDDWLERLKAEEALFHLGFEGHCHPFAPPYEEFDGGPCVDVMGWTSEDKELSCWDYEPEEFTSEDFSEDTDEEIIEQRRMEHNPHYLCDKFGHVEGFVSNDLNVGQKKLAAHDACCFCGGGSHFAHGHRGDEEDLEDYSGDEEEGVTDEL